MDDSIINHLDEIEDNVISELKDFQVATVNRIDYLFRKGVKRVLVSDEVGLGKTLIARGTIAKFAKLRKEEGEDLVKVVYICSNSAIASQNLEKLRIVDSIEVEKSDTSRLSMQHLNIFNQENKENSYIQLIPLTPGTSFKITNSQGTVSERALIYAILKRVPHLKEYDFKLDKLLNYNTKSWDYEKNFYEKKVQECDNNSNGKYLKYMVEKVSYYLTKNNFINEFKVFLDNNSFNESKKYIMELRKIFTNISIDKLNPDLIIMDEFQRFKLLLDSKNDSDMSKITYKFFNTSDLRILMLSATPFKLYSTLDEIDNNISNHYQEFEKIMEFLKNKEEYDNFETIWNNYSTEIKELSKNNNSFIEIKRKAENILYDNICRTERITEKNIADFIDDSSIKTHLNISKEDIIPYIELQKILDKINKNLPIDYVKSTPYLLSFMKNYKIKEDIEKYFKKHPDELNLLKNDNFWLDENKINNFEKIKANNARLENLLTYVLKDNAEKLLWVPPSKPYYPFKGEYEKSENFSKTLIFSSWEMVPRMISSLISYEIERRTIGCLPKNENQNYFAKRRYPYPRMNFNIKEGNPLGMNFFTLIYCSSFLADIYNPIDCLNRKLTLSEIENELKIKIEDKLKYLKEDTTLREDQRWYYLSLLLIDNSYDPESVENWFKYFKDNADQKREDFKGFLAHKDKLKEEFENVLSGKLVLGKKPEDLVDVLCDIAIASPSVCIYRTYKKEIVKGENEKKCRAFTIRLARTFIKRMNLPQSIAVVDLASEKYKNLPYWRKLLIYSKNGNLQAMFDEYAHLLSNGLDKDNKYRVKIIHEKILSSMELRATSYEIDTYKSFKSNIKNNNKINYSMRTHFAASFTKGKSDEKDNNRKKSLQDAFNSPFRPFVLSSTSIGQEGLDFHNYCRRIVHWNLPSNPIDLEQREGRINRFECLAIRKNISKRYGNIQFKDNIWKEMFKEAIIQEKSNNCSDLIPYWGLTKSEDMVKIERIVPMYPFSLDIYKYQRLIKILSLYRLTLGQARQEELFEHLLINNIEKDDLCDLFINLSPFYKEIYNRDLDNLSYD